MSVKSMICALALGLSATASAAGGLLDHSYRPLAGKTPVHLGFTPQFEALEALQAKYKGKGFAVLGFPSGDFKGQEFDDEKQIQQFCTLTYGVKFPMFQKVHVVGDQATPLYRDLAAASGQPPKWNFHKYLIGRDGKVVAAFPSQVEPLDARLTRQIESLLGG